MSKAKGRTLHTIIAMNNKGFDKIKEFDVYENEHNVLHVYFEGGEPTKAILISNFINKWYDELYVYTCESAGIIPLLLWKNPKKLYFSQYGYIFMHQSYVHLRESDGLPEREITGALKALEKDKVLFDIVLRKNRGLYPTIKKNFKEAYSKDIYLTAKKDLSKELQLF